MLLEFENAILDFDKAIAINRGYSKAYIGRGVAKARLNKKREAITDFDHAITLNSHDEIAYYKRGSAKLQLQDIQGALADYNKTLDINPKFVDVYLSRGMLKISSGKNDSGCMDLMIAKELGETEMSDYLMKEYCK